MNASRAATVSVTMTTVNAPTRIQRKSLLAQKGDEARTAAQREFLLETLVAQRWHLTKTAAILGMPGPSQVLRSIEVLGLRGEYEKARGWIKVAI